MFEKRTGRRLGGYERRGRIKFILIKNGYLLSLRGWFTDIVDNNAVHEDNVSYVEKLLGSESHYGK